MSVFSELMSSVISKEMNFRGNGEQNHLPCRLLKVICHTSKYHKQSFRNVRCLVTRQKCEYSFFCCVWLEGGWLRWWWTCCGFLSQWCIRAWTWPSVTPAWVRTASRTRATPWPSSEPPSCTVASCLPGEPMMSSLTFPDSSRLKTKPSAFSVSLQQWSVLPSGGVWPLLDDQSLPLWVPESHLLLLLPRGRGRFVRAAAAATPTSFERSKWFQEFWSSKCILLSWGGVCDGRRQQRLSEGDS